MATVWLLISIIPGANVRYLLDNKIKNYSKSLNKFFLGVNICFHIAEQF